MIFKFTYFYKNKLINEVYTNEVKAMFRFDWLVSNLVPFKVITITKRRNKYYG